MPSGGYVPGDSVFHQMQGAAKLLCFLLLLAAVVMTDSVLGYIVMMGSAAGILWGSGVGVWETAGQVRKLWLFFAVIFLMNTMFYGTEQVLWSWWIFRVSAEGMIQGANVILRVILLLIFAAVLTAVTSPTELTGGIEILLGPFERWPLRLLRIPTADVAMIFSVALQFIPVFMEEADLIRKAQTARGARFESRRLREKAASAVPLVVPVFLSAFRRADELSAAMEARGYGNPKARGRRRKASFESREIAALGVSAVLCVIQIVL